MLKGGYLSVTNLRLRIFYNYQIFQVEALSHVYTSFKAIYSRYTSKPVKF